MHEGSRRVYKHFSSENMLTVFNNTLLPFWKCNFPMNPHVRLSASWSDGRLVCHDFLQRHAIFLGFYEPGEIHFHCILHLYKPQCLSTCLENYSKGITLSHLLSLDLDFLHRYNDSMKHKPESVRMSEIGLKMLITISSFEL